MTMVEPKTNRMPLDEFHTTGEYAALNEHQRVFLDAMAAGDLLVNAARKAYPGTAEKHLRTQVWKLLDSPNVKAAWDKLFGVSPFERICLNLERTARNAEHARDQIEALKTLAKLRGFLGGTNAESEPWPDAPPAPTASNPPISRDPEHGQHSPRYNW